MLSRPVATGVKGGSISSHGPPPSPSRDNSLGRELGDVADRDLRARQDLDGDALLRSRALSSPTRRPIVSASLG